MRSLGDGCRNKVDICHKMDRSKLLTLTTPRCRPPDSVAGIRGQEEQEIRCRLISARRDGSRRRVWSRGLLRDVGAPAGRISTFTEVPLQSSEGKSLRPDGVITVERGKTAWKCLVEVKTGNADLKVDQVSSYLDMARDHGFDAVLTISNQISSGPRDAPVTVDRRKLAPVRPSPFVLVANPDGGGHAAPAQRHQRSRSGLDPRRADRLSRA